MSLYLLLAGVICHGSNAKQNDKRGNAIDGFNHGSRVGLMPDWVRLRLAAWGSDSGKSPAKKAAVKLPSLADGIGAVAASHGAPPSR